MFSSLGLSALNPVNRFPDYHGPYDVGTVDIEIPALDLPTPCDAPEDAADTIAFRIFYPCEKPGKSSPARPVRWIPSPQKETVGAFAKFLGAKDRMASLITYLPQQLYYIKIPALRNATLLDPPTSNSRWPVTMFSHGLAGSRNTYSYVCGDLASYGTIVVALDHRDGSSPLQYVRATSTTPAKSIEAVKISHEPTQETYEGRDKQLRIRLWETAMAYEALIKIDAGQTIENLDDNTSWSKKVRSEVLKQFEGMLDIHRPGKVSWAGHSFGAATVVQLLKNVYYNQEKPSDVTKPLLSPKPDAAVVQQVMPESPTLLLDMWCLPFQSPEQSWLYERPLPSYSHGGPHGDNVLSVLSEAFFKWSANRDATKQVIAAPKPSRQPSRDKSKLLPIWARLRDGSPSSAQDSGYGSERSRSPPNGLTSSATHSRGPHMFYPLHSQHFNQSDFGVLFPWLTHRLAKTEEPERIIDLNVRAMVQVIREAGIEIGGENDAEILDPQAGLRSWVSVSVGGDGGKVNAEAVKSRLSAEEQAPTDVSFDKKEAIEM